MENHLEKYVLTYMTFSYTSKSDKNCKRLTQPHSSFILEPCPINSFSGRPVLPGCCTLIGVTGTFQMRTEKKRDDTL